jgi:hypothetical protein
MPKLLPISVPWMISASVPFLRVQLTPTGAPASATFIGFFKSADAPWHGQFNQKPAVVRSAPEFESRPLSEKAPFRMVRVTFLEGWSVRTLPAVTDAEIVREDDYDWSADESGLKPGETVEQNLLRTREQWLTTGICPSPRMYEVVPSQWLIEEKLDRRVGWHHYLLLGHDEYVEVIAKGWDWQPGQPA